MTDKEMTDAAKSARYVMEKSRTEVMACEEEIKSIKKELKSLTSSAGSAESSLNRLEVSVHEVKVAGDGKDGAAAEKPATFKINLSSPIEDRTITRLHDPLDPDAEGSLAEFESIETSNALLTVEAHSGGDSPRKMGVSAPHDLLPLCQDMELWRKGGEKKSSTLEIAIVAEKGMDDVLVSTGTDEKEASKVDAVDGGEGVEEKEESDEWEDALAEEEKEGGEGRTDEKEKENDAIADEEKEAGEGGSDEKEGGEGGSDEKEGEGGSDEKENEGEEEGGSPAEEDADASALPAARDDGKATELMLPLYTLTIRLEYTPSPDDKRDALYDALNEVSKRKVAAIDSLRRSAVVANRAKAAEAPTGGGGKSPAVKSGFLNKSKAPEEVEKPPPFWKRWYGKTIGPQSMMWVVGPIAKNYVLFVGVSLFIHFKGDLLALPPVV